MRWIASSGGPLIVMPESISSYWTGTAGREAVSDYERACQVIDFCGVITCHNHDVLVLGDEPNLTAIDTEGSDPFIVRWRYAPSEADILDCLRSIPWENPVESIQWTVNDGNVVIFDSALHGESIGEYLSVRLVPGIFIVYTYLWEPAKDIGLLLHLVKRQT